LETLKIDPRTADLDDMIERGTHLHGHLGPFLVAGIHMGLLALDLLESHRTATRPLEELFVWEQGS